MNLKKTIISLTMLLAASGLSAQKTFDINLWPKNPPHSNGDRADTARVRVFLPAEKEATGRCVVIFPGGGYSHLAMDHEGYDWGPFFNNLGIAAVVVKYRMPHGNVNVPVEDAEQAMKLVRRNAAAWHIKTNEVGVMGSSAGGHLASTLATHSQKEAKPNFQILFYPVITMMPGYTHQGSHDNLLGNSAKKKQERDYSNDTQVSRLTPRAWIALSDDDDVVAPANGVNYYTELYRHDVPASLHVYPVGGHGWGSRIGFRHHLEMTLSLIEWLRSF